MFSGTGQYGFAMNNGQPEIFFAGRHVLLSPLSSYYSTESIGNNNISVGPISIVRIPQGSIGLARANHLYEILLPGLHARNDASWALQSVESMDRDLISLGPIKLFIVRSGCARVCYNNGKVVIYREGRYAVNSATFTVNQLIPTQQQNLRFTKHLVLLDGGISMLVEGLLTYQVESVETLIYQLGDRDLKNSIEDVTKAELSRVFAAIHLEQISSAANQEEGKGKQDAMLGKDQEIENSAQGNTRSKICSRIISDVGPIAARWGVKIINFQLESTTLADKQYAAEYEAASLQMAKAKSNLRALDAQNQLLIQKSRAEAQSVQIQAEGTKQRMILQAQAQASAMTIDADARVLAAESEKRALLIRASAEAQARVIEAQSRNDAAVSMDQPFAKQYALAGQEVQFAANLKATVLTVSPESAIGKQVSSSMGGSSMNKI
jgi:regulator of protease activity HflC (stomatin/prohibitin superfamily)